MTPTFPEPHYFLLVAGLLTGLLCGKAFEVSLRQGVSEWAQTKSNQSLVQLQGMQLWLPYSGICAGICVFLASGFTIFAFPVLPSYAVAAGLTAALAALIWAQLKSTLKTLAEGGSAALDLNFIR